MSKHTPGPWKARASRRIYDDTMAIVDQREGKTIAHVPADDTAEIEDGAIAQVMSAEGSANANLIAAAPEMLEALKWLLLEVRPEDVKSNPTVWAAKAAIAKAEGR